MEIPQEVKIGTIIQFSNSTPEYLAEQNKNTNEEGGTRGHTRSRIRYEQQEHWTVKGNAPMSSNFQREELPH